MDESARLLIVDDDRELRELLVENLTAYGFGSEAVGNGREMFQALERSSFDLILLDIMMPGEDGLSLCRSLRAPGGVYASIPIIFLTALSDTTDTVVGLEMGADDYLAKPFQARELVARIRALLRRSRQMEGNGSPAVRGLYGNAADKSLILFGDWKLNVLARHLIDAQGVVVPLSAAEFRLLILFLEHPQQVVTRDRIMEHLAEHNLNIYDRSIDAQVRRLRAKLRDKGTNPDLIKTMRGDGYMLAVPVRRGEA
ncbi:DNA-binding response regulator [Deltaproteobacteria bacterium Smac51]|nr:DNA-binding response regulator [Deltaproteobacteria bacterium Smac51]